MRTCRTCGREAPEDFAFCPDCGSSLAPEAPTGARRSVTILFSDIVGSTALGERLDPERLQAVLARYFDAMRQVIQGHGGTIEKFIGDAVMAVFGVPHVREDDALRAVRAAADMRDALNDLNAELLETQGIEIQVRTGVNTGEVVVTDVGAEGTLAAGDAVNIAARFEQAAGAGEILIGEATFRLVRDAILGEPIDPLVVKGKAEPLVAYRVVKVDPHAAGFSRRLDAPMVGRERELQMLLGAFDRTFTDQACHLFTVLGVGGVGKSRLLDAFVSALGDRATVLRGRCLPYGEGITFLPIEEAVRQAAMLTGLEEPGEARERIAALVGADEHAERIVAQVAQIVGVAGGEATPEETLWAIRKLLEGMARERPVVFLLDDVQWAEPMMLELIEHVADWSVDAPILLACMARPELLDSRPDWGGGKLNATSISLEPLTVEECGILVANLLAMKEIAPEVRERVAQASEGHPLFAEELLGMLVDEGRLSLVDDVWVPTGDLGTFAVPPTTSALLAARLDGLAPAHRALLERASVIGQVFYRVALAELADDPDLDAHLAALMRRQFVRPDRSDLVGAEALAFRHLLIRDVAYEGLTKSVRAELHQRFADWLERQAPDEGELIGYHLERSVRYFEELGSGDGRTAEIADRAAKHLVDAGQQAFVRGDMPATTNLLSRAASLMRPEASELVSLYSDLAQAQAERGELDDAYVSVERAVGVAQARRNDVAAARARTHGNLLFLWGHRSPDEVRTIEGEARASLPLFEAADDPAGAAFAWANIGTVLWSRCRAGEARAAWRKAVDGFEFAGDRWLAGEYLGWLSSVYAWGPTPCDQALRGLEMLAVEARGAPGAEIGVSASIATVQMMLGDLDGARRLFEAHDMRMLELGLHLPLAHHSQHLGLLELLSGNHEESEQILGAGARRLEEMGSDAVGIIAAFHAQSLYALGRYEEADEEAQKSMRASRDAGSETTIALGVRAMVAARLGRIAEAEDLARTAIELIDESDFTTDRADARAALAEVLELAGRREEAIGAANEALSLYEEKGNLLQAGHARERLRRLAG